MYYVYGFPRETREGKVNMPFTLISERQIYLPGEVMFRRCPIDLFPTLYVGGLSNPPT
jgi:hypothetical protein